MVIRGLSAIVIGLLAWRILCEMAVAVVRISDTLTDIKNAMCGGAGQESKPAQ